METDKHHRPLVSGILIRSGKTENNTLREIAAGTLTGLATRNSDGKKVLVTNLHVMVGVDDNGNLRNPSGTEEIYQETVTQSKKVGTILPQGWVRITSGLNNSADVAICGLDDDVLADFTLHDNPHSRRQILQGTVEPVKNSDNPMQLTMMGGALGEESTATVTDVNKRKFVQGIGFIGVTVLDLSQNPSVPGDSGAAYLYKAGDGRYKMCCIGFASSLDGRTGFAFPASVAERELGITFGNTLPVASATVSPATALPGATVTLDGSGSSAPDGDALTYQWEQVPGVGGGSVALTNADKAIATFTAPSSPAALTFRLTVTDSAGLTATDTVNVNVSAVEALGTLAADSVVTHSGSWSSNIPSVNREGCYARFYAFSLDRRRQLQIDLTSSEDTYLYLLSGTGTSGEVLEFNDDVEPPNYNSRIVIELDAGEYTIEATTYVGGTTGDFDLSIGSPINLNRAPTAYAGADRTTTPGATVTLLGSGDDPDGDTLEYAWTQLSGTPVGLTNSTIPRPWFTAPSSEATLVFRLTVTDPDRLSHTDDVTITVRSVANSRPEADAGRNQSVSTGARVTLDGSDSSDPDGDDLTYRWTQQSGTTVSLSSARVASPTFTAPSEAGGLSFRLTVTDEHGASDSDDVTIAVRATNRPPEADAGSNRSVEGGARVTLDGSNSSDPDGDRLTYSWALQSGGVSVSLSGSSSARATFTAPYVTGRTTFTFRLTVTDPDGLSDTADVAITVLGSEGF